MADLSTYITPTVTIVVTVISVVVSNRLSLTRSYSEKAWDIRREVYGQILFELSQASTKCRWVDDSYAQHGWSIFQGENKTLEEVYEHYSSAWGIYGTNVVIVSDEFVSRFDEFRNASANSRFGDADPIDDFETLAKALHLHLPILTAQARAEVVVRRWRWPRRLPWRRKRVA